MRICGCILDLDGVITRTAEVHARAWKSTFDPFLRAWGERQGLHHKPFELPRDYLHYVDGKSRLDGVRDFLAARGIVLPEGRESDPETAWSVHGLGRAKNARFQELVDREGVGLYEGTLQLMDQLRARGIPQAVVSSSRNARYLLERSALLTRFDAVVDGDDSERLGLAGKPAPDQFLEAARRLQCPPDRLVLIEDAAAGVEAGRRGGFGLVVGIDRGGNRDALREHGAHRVVGDLAELPVGEVLALSPRQVE